MRWRETKRPSLCEPGLLELGPIALFGPGETHGVELVLIEEEAGGNLRGFPLQGGAAGRVVWEVRGRLVGPFEARWLRA